MHKLKLQANFILNYYKVDCFYSFYIKDQYLWLYRLGYSTDWLVLGYTSTSLMSDCLKAIHRNEEHRKKYDK